MTSQNRVPFDRTRNLALARLYYDANSYIAGALETLSVVRAHPNYLDIMSKVPEDPARLERRKQEEAMAILFSRWNPRLAFVSPHTLLEALDVATRRYELPVEQVLGIIIEGIERDFTLLPAEFEMVRSGREIIKRLEAKVPRSWEYAKVGYRAMARDAQGNPLGTVYLGEALTSGAGHVSTQGGSPETFKNMRFLDAPQSHTIRDP